MRHLPIISFWALGVIWGSNFIYMKLASQYISPSQIVLLRVLCGFIPVLIYAVFTASIKRSHIRYLKHFFVMALLATAAYYYGFAKGTSLLSSGVAGALSGSIPIFSLLLALVLIKEEKATIYKSVGLIIGLSAVIIIAAPFEQGVSSTNSAGVFYMTLGSLSLGASFIYAKKYVVPLKIATSALTTYQLGIALIMLLLVTDLQGITEISASTHALAGIIVGLGLLGTGLAYLIYYYIIEHLGAVNAASVTYIPPVVALIIGAFIANEAISLAEYFAAALILLAVVLVNKKPQDELELQTK